MLNFNDFLTETERLIENELFKLDAEIKKFDENKGKMPYDKAVEEVEKILKKYSDAITKTLDKFTVTMKKYTNRGKAKFIYDTKTVTSVVSKVVSRGKKLTDLGDLVRGAILFDSQEELDEFVKNFTRKESSMITDHDHKEKGGDKTYGYYGSHHFDLNINGLTVELQAMTKKLWKFKDNAHDIYNKTRDSGVITKADIELSKKIFKLGNAPKFVKESSELNEQASIWVVMED